MLQNMPVMLALLGTVSEYFRDLIEMIVEYVYMSTRLYRYQ